MSVSLTMIDASRIGSFNAENQIAPTPKRQL